MEFPPICYGTMIVGVSSDCHIMFTNQYGFVVLHVTCTYVNSSTRVSARSPPHNPPAYHAPSPPHTSQTTTPTPTISPHNVSNHPFQQFPPAREAHRQKPPAALTTPEHMAAHELPHPTRVCLPPPFLSPVSPPYLPRTQPANTPAQKMCSQTDPPH